MLPRTPREALVLAGFLLACFMAAVVGTAGMGVETMRWYAGLNAPSFAPPAWVFGPAWTLLYALMGWAAFLAWRRAGLRSRALALFAGQLALNAAWTPVFFGMRRPGAALVVILALWAAILATLLAFRAVDRRAGRLLVPYLAWVTFAACLNFEYWRLNAPAG